MKVSVAQCDCGSAEPHRKLETADGTRSRGFFAVEDGKALHDSLLASGTIEQSAEEEAATVKEIESCGLPQNNPLAPPPPASLSDEMIQFFAKTLVQTTPADEFPDTVLAAYAAGAFNREDGKKILAMARLMSRQT